MTFTVMKAMVLDLIAEENNDRFDDTFVGRAVNLGCVDFLDKCEAIDTHWTIDTVADQMWYLSPTNCFELTRVEWVDDWVGSTDFGQRLKLERKTFKEMDDEYPLDTSRAEDNTSWQEITGDPVVWIPKEHDVIGIYPACDTSDDKLFLYGRKKHVDMDEDANTPGFADQWHIIPCIYAARMLLRSDNDEKAAGFERWYKEEVMMAKRTIMERKKHMPSTWRMYAY